MKNRRAILLIFLLAVLEVIIAFGVATLGVEIYNIGEKKYFVNKWQDLNESANKGNVDAQFILGQFHMRRSKYLPEEYKSLFEYLRWNSSLMHFEKTKGAYWLLQAAKQGHGDSQAELAQCYKFGDGVEQDFEKCIVWLKKGCKSGSPLAQWLLGNLYCYGLSYEYNYSEDKYYWLYGTVSVGHGYMGGLKEGDPIYYEMGTTNSYLTRKGLENAEWRPDPIVFLERDIKKAKYYWTLSAEQGFKEAIESLQKVYEDD